MNKHQAVTAAEAIGDEAWHSGRGIWLVRITRKDASLAVISDDLVCAYQDEDAFREGRASAEVQLE